MSLFISKFGIVTGATSRLEETVRNCATGLFSQREDSLSSASSLTIPKAEIWRLRK